MADEIGKDPYSDADALEELYASALSDINDDSLSDFDMGDIPIEDILEASDNIEVPSFDAYSDAIDTSELDELLEKENAVVVDGAIDSGFNIEDVDWDNMTLDDLMEDDFDDVEENTTEIAAESEVKEETSVTDEMPAIATETVEGNDVISEESDIEMSEDILSEMAEVSEKHDDVETAQDISEEFEEIEDSEFEEISEDTNDGESIEESAGDNVPKESASDENETEEISDESGFDLMDFLANDDPVEFETLDDDEFEILDNEEPSGKTRNTRYTTDGRKNVKQHSHNGVKAGNVSSTNVFEESLSAVSGDFDDTEIGIDEVEALLENVKKDSKEKKKKKGKGFGKLFANIVDDKEIEKVEKEKNAAAQAELNKQKKAELKKVNAEKKAQKKEERKLENARKAEERKKKVEAKRRAKREAKEIRELEEETEIEGRINKAGAIIVFLILGCMAVAVFLGTKMFSYSNSISNARNYFESGQYEESYNELVGLEIKEEDKVLYEKVVTIMHVYKQLDAYEMYYKEQRYPQALDALLKGVREYEKNIAKATELDITSNMDEIKNQIIHELSVEYGITEDIAREVNQITDSKAYSMRVYELAKELSSDYY